MTGRQAVDVWGDRWRVAETRETHHGFGVLLGRPESGGRQGKTVICTRSLSDYLAAHALTPQQVEIPIGRTAIKRLRRLLGLGWWEARAQWWVDRSADLRALTIDEFVARHGGSTGAACLARQRLIGKVLGEPLWHMQEPQRTILLTQPAAVVSDAWDVPASSVRRLRWMIRQAEGKAT